MSANFHLRDLDIGYFIDQAAPISETLPLIL